VRLFVAIELSERTRGHLAVVQERLRAVARDASWAGRDSLHLTLKFLGEVRDDRVAQVCEALNHVRGESFEIVPSSLVCFPPRGPIRIIGAQIGVAGPQLHGLQQAVEDQCAAIGFARESRRYTPHATLARCRRPLRAALRQRLADSAAGLFPGEPTLVERFVLMQSVLDSRGARYSVAAGFPLAGGH
jgi:2'-5' RNA ligase